jgi:hypothetical protein
MVLAIPKDPRNRLALLRDAQSLVGAQLFDVDLAMHDAELGCG